jgi:6-phosphofructokinase 2
MKTIATLTMNPTIDISASVAEVISTRKLRCDDVRREPGGGGINVARAIHRLGGKAVPFYISGGATGQMLHKLLRRESVEDRTVEIEKLTRESFTVFEKSSGKQYRFVLPGPEIRKREWEQCLEMLRLLTPFPAFFVASGSLPPGVPEDFYARAAESVGRIGARLILDTSGAPLRKALEKGVFLAKPNRRELEEIVGESLEDPAAQEKACRDLVQRGCCQSLVLTLGDKGSLLTTPELQRRAPPLDVKVESAVGAGDSFVAGMTIALARGNSMEEAFLYGVAAGTAAVMTPGTELCRKEDTDRLFDELKRTAD